ncbi:MAG: spore germination protein [Defluviitaleaceae bacterium]|nr:spore germination protein [Defluviitaleaceae bacterium]
MQETKNDKISLRQLQALLILEIFGFGVTDLPRRVAAVSGQDGWISVILGVLAVAFALFIICKLSARFSDMSFHGYATATVGSALGGLLTVLFAIRLILLAAFNLRIFGEIVRETLLPTTPLIIIFLSMLCLAGYGASKGFESRARVAELLFLIVFLPLILVFGISSRDMDFTNLLPIFAASPQNILSGAYHGFFAFSGIEVLLLVSPYLSRPKNITKSMMGALGVIGVFMVLCVVAAIARFGSRELSRQLWAVLRMMDTLSLPGSIIDRQGALIMTFWIISAFAVINAALFFSSLLLKDLGVSMGIGFEHKAYIWILAPIIAFIAQKPRNLIEVHRYMEMINNTFGLAFMLIIPFLLLVISGLRNMGKRR